MPETDDLAFLLGRVAVGDKRAMEALYTSVGPNLHRFIQTKLSDPHEAADVLQETMLEVWRRAGGFAGQSAVRTWIFAIARNKAVDRLRKATPTLAEPDETIPDGAPDPEAALEAVDNKAALFKCIAKLKEVQRSAIHLAYFRDIAYADIAEIENCSEGTVKSRIHHAKKLLLHCLSADGGR
ncbi:MAG: sigma-70 family RNA polymerase sigma factor [Pseudomonadota bacterium]